MNIPKKQKVSGNIQKAQIQAIKEKESELFGEALRQFMWRATDKKLSIPEAKEAFWADMARIREQYLNFLEKL